MSGHHRTVFISYQRSDEAFARQVREHLAAHGVKTWMDQYNIPVGAYWPDEIDKGLAGSDIVVGVLSPEAIESRNVKNEWDWAIQNDKRLLLVKVAPTTLPHRYVSINFIDATGADAASAMATLLAALGVDAAETAGPPPLTQYARSGDVNIAFQMFGEGPIDLVITPGFVSHLDLQWDDPLMACYHRRLAAFARVIQFDKRGTGLSDRVADIPTLEQRVDDLRAVMDAAGIDRAALMGVSEGGPLSIAFAAAHPHRTVALILYGTSPRFSRAPDFPWGTTIEEQQEHDATIVETWGRDMSADLATFAPSMVGNSDYVAWLTRMSRAAASPGAALALAQMNRSIDVRNLLPRLNVPTLIVHRVGDRDTSIEVARYTAKQMPNATLVELSGDDHFPWLGDQAILAATIQSFLASHLGIPGESA